MRLVVAACVAFLCIGSGRLAAGQQLTGWFDLPVPGGAATLDALGIAPSERALTLPILVRAIYDREARIGLTPARVFGVIRNGIAKPDEDDSVSVPAPLDARTWRQLLPPPDNTDLLLRIVTDRNALMLASGLMSADPSVRAWLGKDRDLLKYIYQHGAGAFAVVARSLQVAGNRIAAPGGAQADAIWRSLSGAPPSRPGPFLRALLTKDAGRLAWYYDTIAGLDQDRLAVAWPGTQPLEEAERLYESFRDADSQWRLQEQPFRRAVADAWTVVTQIDPAGSASASVLPQELWSVVFSGDRVNRDHVTRALRDRTTPTTLSWLVKEIVMSTSRDRRVRFELFRLAQRMFPGASENDLSAITVALATIRDYRALTAALDRMQVRNPATLSAAGWAARHINDDADDRNESLVAFQGALALIERMRHVRALDADRAEHLVHDLSQAVVVNNRVVNSVANWIVDRLIPALPPLVKPDAFTGKTAYESTVLQALAGPAPSQERPSRRLDWEGLSYVVDIAAAEHERLRATRAMLPSPGLDDALASRRPRDIANALTYLVYATALGDPEGPASLSPDVATRHEFGFSGTVVTRELAPWSPAEERQGFGAWHVQGALLSLDLALSRLAMRRINDDQLPAAPTLTLNDLGTLTRTAVAMVSADLTDHERDEIAAAMERGRARVRAAGVDIERLDALAREIRMSDTTRQLLPWTANRMPAAPVDQFSLSQLLWLGKPALTRAQLDKWGVAADGVDGRRTTAMPPPAPWEDFAGRSEAGQVTTQVPDLTLRLADEAARLKLPAVLVPSLLGFALEDYWHDVQARFADDWLQLTRQAALVPSSRIHDYVAALTGSGPLRTQ